MNPHPKFGSYIETDDVIQHQEDMKRFINYIMEVSGESKAGLSSRFKMA